MNKFLLVIFSLQAYLGPLSGIVQGFGQDIFIYRDRLGGDAQLINSK